MSVISVVLIGLALAMDAVGVSLGIGVNSQIDRQKKIGYITSFGFFQFLLTFLGAKLGYYFDSYIAEIPSFMGGIILIIVGMLMIRDGNKNKEETVLSKNSMMLVLGISVSIDAFVIGFSVMHHLASTAILMVDSILIGLITLFLCTLAFFISNYIRRINFVSKYANYIGGITLILFAIKIMVANI